VHFWLRSCDQFSADAVEREVAVSARNPAPRIADA
jgi:hypothetical protein